MIYTTTLLALRLSALPTPTPSNTELPAVVVNSRSRRMQVDLLQDPVFEDYRGILEVQRAKEMALQNHVRLVFARMRRSSPPVVPASHGCIVRSMTEGPEHVG
ncbi:hypothetical protein C8F01DRAFT_1254460 [Mycena amicta]|nr:hypothetical protein C8F01DRAFT_1254460 [Mycena amicta]